MTADTHRPRPTDRKTWHAPRVERLIAGDAQNAFTPARSDGVYSTS